MEYSSPSFGPLQSRRWMMVSLLLMVSGCVHLEIDRESGTAPIPVITHNGAPLDLETIYKNAGVTLEVEEDEVVNVPTPPAVSCITDAELDAFEASHRNSPIAPSCMICTYYLYGVIVNHLHNSDGSYPCEPCTDEGGLCTAGSMWATDDRRAFAVFYAHPNVRNDPSWFLLTAAHEAGHAHGVHHADGNEDFDNPTLENDGLFFMFTTGNFEFSDQSREHLQFHPVRCRRPGGGSFYSIDSEHAAWPGHGLYDPTCF
jgi:hypothetical protein